jgi:hypothetical protein
MANTINGSGRTFATILDVIREGVATSGRERDMEALIVVLVVLSWLHVGGVV